MKPLLFGGDVPSNLFFFFVSLPVRTGARAHDSIFRPTQLVKNIDSKNSHPKCILAVDNFLNDCVKIFCVLSMLPNPCRTNTCGGCRSCSFLFDRRIAFCALLVQHCSVSRTKCFHCFLAVLCFVMAILYVNQRFCFSDS